MLRPELRKGKPMKPMKRELLKFTRTGGCARCRSHSGNVALERWVTLHRHSLCAESIIKRDLELYKEKMAHTQFELLYKSG